MAIEWSNANKYNSFNSYKGLIYYEHYKQIVGWLNRERILPPPIECNLDPVARCNLSCYFCIGQRYLRHHREEIGVMDELPTEYIYRLVDFLVGWGVKGLCISGGGEPSLHKGIRGLIPYAVSRGMDVSFVTNGTLIDDELAQSLMFCRWVALSIDSADRQTYKRVKGNDKFGKAISGISRLASLRRQTNSKVDLCFKYLILPENMYSIHKACQLAKDLGVQDFHARPVDFERGDIVGAKKLNFDIQGIEEEFAKCYEEEADDFHVFTIRHKFNPMFLVEHDFKRCLATPLIIPILTDGNAYLCVEKKMMADFRLGLCYPNPESILDWWGSEEHRKLVEGVNIQECSRCVYAQYNRQMGEVVIQDRMCRNFP